ncbi:hypothetical protein D3C86_1757810 [compost metagenome]
MLTENNRGASNNILQLARYISVSLGAHENLALKQRGQLVHRSPGFAPAFLCRHTAPASALLLQAFGHITQRRMEQLTDIRRLELIELAFLQPQTVGSKMREGAGDEFLHTRHAAPQC